jgi:biopolymer transport protein TolR
MAALASRRSGSRRRVMNEINVVPYIDVMLVLLVIFMVTAPLVTPGQIELPSMGKASQPPAKPFEIVIRQTGAILVRDRESAAPEAEADRARAVALAKAAQIAKPDRPVIISADKAVRYEEVLSMMDALRQANVGKVGLSVKPAGK